MQREIIENAMRSQKITIERMAKELGISADLMRRKLGGHSEFNLIQAVLISELLRLPNPREVFF